jgi:hypothetical protein
MTSRNCEHLGNGIGFSETYVNGRIQNNYLTYNAAGDVVHQGDSAILDF